MHRFCLRETTVGDGPAAAPTWSIPGELPCNMNGAVNDLCAKKSIQHLSANCLKKERLRVYDEDYKERSRFAFSIED